MNNFNKAKAIYKSSSGLDNISEELKTQFDTIMLGGKQLCHHCIIMIMTLNLEVV